MLHSETVVSPSLQTATPDRLQRRKSPGTRVRWVRRKAQKRLRNGRGLARGLWTLAAAFTWAASSVAGVLDRAQLAQVFPPPLVVGERYAALPVWPIFEPSPKGPQAVAHVFETIDIEPVSGYGGKPLNLLVAVDREGKFLDVRLIGHSEPIFMSPKGTAQLDDFARQYVGLSLNHTIQVLSPKAQRSQTETTAVLHGVTAGTVSALAIDKSIMEAAARVAQVRLDDPQAKRPAREPRGPNDRYERTGWNALVNARLVQNVALTNRQLEARFKETPAAGGDAEGTLRPQGLAIDLWIALLGLPQAGRNLLDAAGWRQIRDLREAGTQVFVLFDNSRYSLTGNNPRRNARGLSVEVQQAGRRMALQELQYEHRLLLTGQRSGVGTEATPRFFRTAPQTGLDMGQPMTFHFRAARLGSDETRLPIEVEFEQAFAIPHVQALLPVRETPAWLKVWEQRRFDLLILVSGLLILTMALARQTWLSQRRGRLAAFRLAYLVFTLGFIGWHAQGQLTIVNLTSLTESLIAGGSADFLLADPMAVVLWAFVGFTLLVWGRGTFCGWLCPFGAFQELLSMVTKRLGFKPHVLHTTLDAQLKRIKYAIFALTLGAACVTATGTALLVEIEPFKTSISMSFQRDWPYVAWAVLCLAASVFVYRGYCRYLCPLGAGLALLDRLRLWKWIARRAECGTPCQTCRHRCEYQAIAPSGAVDYSECFQCLDCVGIHQDEKRCMPLIRERKGRVIPLIPVRVVS